MSKGKAPEPPDPYETAEAQTGQNVATAIANTAMGQVNQVGPDGTLTYDQTGTFSFRDPSTGQVYDLPQYTATTELSEEAQEVRDAQNRADITLSNLGADQAERAGDLLSTPFDPASISPERYDWNSVNSPEYGDALQTPNYQRDDRDYQGLALPDYSEGQAGPEFGQMGTSAGLQTSYIDDFGAQKDEVVEGLWGQIDEQRGRDLESLRTDLFNRGLTEGTEAWEREMEAFQSSVDESRLAALLAGGQEQSRLANLAYQQASFGNTARQAEFGNELTGTTYNDDRSLDAYGISEDRARYDDAMDLGLYDRATADNRFDYQTGTEQLNYNNMMEGQEFADDRAVQGREDAITGLQFDQEMALGQNIDGARARALDEAFAARNQPINEITALLSGSQVDTPNFSIAQPYAMPTTDIAGLVNQNYNQQFANYQADQQQQQAMMGGLFNLGAAAMIGTPWATT